MPRFSIIVPVYNKEKYIYSTAVSILKQEFSDFELILVNDGSLDNSLKVMKSIDDSRIQIVNKVNGGVSSARNYGINVAHGEWITFLDADDIMYPNALATYDRLIKEFPDISVFVAATDQSNKKYNSTGVIKAITDYHKYNAISYAKSGFSLINTDCICINKRVFETVGVFNEDYTHGEDLDLWQRITDKYPFVKIEKAISLYVQEVSNNSSSVAEKKRKYSPIAKLEWPRKELKSNSLKLLQGARIFFHVFPNGYKANIKGSMRLMVKYVDCILLFVPVLLYYRIIKR